MIANAVLNYGVAQSKVAQVWGLSAGRVFQIVERHKDRMQKEQPLYPRAQYARSIELGGRRDVWMTTTSDKPNHLVIE